VNQLKLVASITEKAALRYTPAGIPIATGVLQHGGQEQQAQVVRNIDFEINAIAAGEISKRFLEIELGQVMLFTGFLARKNRNSKSLVFHIAEFETHLLDLD
jgi:primosomal replication protein N